VAYQGNVPREAAAKDESVNGNRTDLSNTTVQVSNVCKSRGEMVAKSTRGHVAEWLRNGLQNPSDKTYTVENTDKFALLAASGLSNDPPEKPLNPPRLSNVFGVKQYRRRGRGYAYIRGTSIALVRGFVGDDDAFTAAVKRAAMEHEYRTKASLDGWREDAAVALHKGTSRRAASRGRSYTLSVEWIKSLFIAAGDRCQITGMLFDYTPAKNELWRRRPYAPSLDRKDNTVGYDTTNVRAVCVCVNIAINEWGLDNFAKMCRAFVERNAT